MVDRKKETLSSLHFILALGSSSGLRMDSTRARASNSTPGWPDRRCSNLISQESMGFATNSSTCIRADSGARPSGPIHGANRLNMSCNWDLVKRYRVARTRKSGFGGPLEPPNQPFMPATLCPLFYIIYCFIAFLVYIFPIFFSINQKP